MLGKRIVIAVAVAALTAATAATVSANPRVDGDCPAAASGFERVDRDGWWANVVIGFGVAGITVYEPDGTTYTAAFEAFAESWGFASAQDFKDWILGDMWAGLDKNDNGRLCMKPMPVTPGNGNPGYYFTATDDRVQGN